MCKLIILLVCIQACLLQNIFGCSCGCNNAGSLGLGYGTSSQTGWADQAGYGAGLGGSWAGLGGCGSGLVGSGSGLVGYGAGLGGSGAGLVGYGAGLGGSGLSGAGIGDVEVAGGLGVGGTTLVTGTVPVLGAVQYSEYVPARGSVIIQGSCSCGCGCNGGY